MICLKNNALFSEPDDSEPLAMIVHNVCKCCGNETEVWMITDSEWEYRGSSFCAPCLHSLADVLTEKGL